MAICIIMLILAFAWLLYETNFMQVRLESTEYQRAMAKGKAKIATLTPTQYETVYETVIQFTPLVLPVFTGTLNIACKRSIQ